MTTTMTTMTRARRRIMWRLRALPGSPVAGLAVVAVALFVDMLLYSLVVPILPGYAATLGASPAAVGLLFASYAIAFLLATPGFGALSDRVGRRATLLGGLIGLAAATLLFAFADGFVELVIARLLQGTAAAATWTAGLALLADLFPPKERGKAMGIAVTGMAVGTLVGAPFGGLLFEWGGYRLPFLLAAGLALLDGLARVILLADPPRTKVEPVGLLDLVCDRRVLTTAWAIGVGAGVLSLVEPILPLHLRDQLGASPSTIGVLFGATMLAYAMSAPLSGALSDRWGRRPAMAAGLIGLGLAVPLLALPKSLLAEAVALLLVGAAAGLALAPTLPELAEAVDYRGGWGYASVYAVFNVAYGLGMMAGPSAGGFLAGSLGLPVTLALAGVAALAPVPTLLASTAGVRCAESNGELLPQEQVLEQEISPASHDGRQSTPQEHKES